MSKDRMIQILDYYIDYEFHTRMMDNCIKGKGRDEPIELLQNLNEIIKIVQEKKLQEIKKMLVKEIKSSSLTEKEIGDKAKEIVDDKIEIRSFVEKVELKKFKSKDALIEKIKAIKNNSDITICYPLIESKGKEKIKKPVITFLCELKNNVIEVKEYYINIESLLIILAYAEDSTPREIELAKAEIFNDVLSKINNIEGQTKIDKIIKLIDSELFVSFDNSRINSILQFENEDNWHKLNRIFITIEQLNEMKVPIFEDEIGYCKKNLEYKKSSLLEKYLLGNNDAAALKKVSDKFRFHYGSYTDKYAVNEKQWEVVTLSNESEILSVDGPPGTGKTTVLKEIIADNITQKAKKLVDCWNVEWKKVTDNNGTIYREWLVSPLGGENKHSIVLTSTNNKAVDNIGIELLEEIPFFSEIFNGVGKETKGVLCARLGKKNNVENFYNDHFVKFIELLKNVNEDELSDKSLLQFNELWNQLEQIKETLMRFNNSRQEVCRALNEKYFKMNSLKEESTKLKKELKIKKTLKGEKLQELTLFSDEKYNIDQEKKRHENIKTNIEEELKEARNLNKNLYKIQEEYKCRSKNRIVKFIACLISKKWKEFFINYPSETYIENEIKSSEDKVSKCSNIIRDLNSKLLSMEENIKKIQSNIEKNKLEISSIDNEIAKLDYKVKIIASYIKICEETENSIEYEEISDKNLYQLINCNKVLNLRKQMFDASLRVTELYIKKNRKSIITNLELILNKTDNTFRWCQKFYSSEQKFTDEKKGAIIALWETFFLCFPVVTTTLHSFSKYTFQIIQGLFDLLMIDEAGQIMPHYLPAPFYRAKRSIVVGDTKQLEPIRLLREDIIAKSKVDKTMQDIISINGNSAQSYVDRSSDVYEIFNGEKVGIVLNEHRRCEKNIMKFSNDLIYKGLLSVKEDNDYKKLFGSNLIAFDIRGTKEKYHFNKLEISVCKKIIEEYKTEYGEGVLKNVAIISPFKRQVQELKQEIAQCFPAVEIGTVHTFQGREKDIVIFSTVIDDVSGKKKGLSDFIGLKGNLLNVAFSRAKKQFVLVGNFEQIEQGSPYLKDALRIIKENGKSYSFFNLNLSNESEKNAENWKRALSILTSGNEIAIDSNLKLRNFISENCPKNIVIGSAIHYKLLKGVIKLAENEICIFSPWINEYVVDDDFYELIKEAAQRLVKINICFGYEGKKVELDNENNIIEILNHNGGFGNDRSGTAAIILKMKRELDINIVYSPPIHTKLLLIDGRYMLIGSHNWLANGGKSKSKNSEYKEMSCLITNSNSISYVKDKYISRFLGEVYT